MTLGKHLIALLFSALVVIPCSTPVLAQTSSEVAKAGPPTASVEHDGQHDFDSLAGTGKVIRSTALTPSLDLIRGSSLMALKFSKNFGTAPCSSGPKWPAPMDLSA
jgi:hypothetical protein